MMRLSFAGCLAGILLVPTLSAQTPAAITKVDPALDALIDSNASLEKLAGDLGFLEGPLWMQEGHLLFSDLFKNTVWKMVPGGKPEAFLTKAGWDKDGPPQVTHFGPNGMVVDKQGRLVFCQQGNRQVVRLEKDGTRTLLFDKFDGKRLNGPNDIIKAKDGTIYFSDPPYGLPKRSDAELAFCGVYRIRDGKLDVMIKELAVPNGLAFSPDEKYLFVADGSAIKRFDVQKDGTFANPTVFFDLATLGRRGSPDGFRVDAKGNVFTSGRQGIYIISPEGKHIGTINVPENPANCTFGGKDGHTLFITAQSGLYAIQTKTSGSAAK
ncbi:MAG: SMP-30/gluconolactonase/LRE family protein [Candidatus Solibacter sp.]